MGKSQNPNRTKYPQVIVENTENLPNPSSYTIEYKSVRNSHLLSQNWHFLKVPQQLFYKQALIAHTQKLSKQHSTAHTSIVKGYTAKCYKHAHFSLQSALLWSLVLVSQLTFPHRLQNNKPSIYCKIQHKHIIMAHSSRTKSSISIDLFNLPLLPDTRKALNNDM